ncbi:terpenoid synthase [Neolentinus lepideus HHB14362 ss-1]|uniref:Terpene synthase n=1 Tax=Neolentinus lepideus HHB14362 ss-1 TaxID=1314782 RepID=A0A165VQ15_9AGAM|nr:terpenoid synthase [Neolentinus lepideus HHB14362 ss-1]
MVQAEFVSPNLDTLRAFPLLCNPLYDIVRAESSKWIESFGHYLENPQKRDFLRSANFELLGSYTYPTADYEALRAICDWFNAIFVLDEITDDQSGDDAAKTMQAHVDGLAGNPGDGSTVYKIFEDLGKRLRVRFGPKAFHRFLASSEGYAKEVAREAQLRGEDKVLPFHDYVPFRRQISGVQICLDLIEYAFNFDLPDEITDQTRFKEINNITTDFVAWTNDIYSYPMEHRKGGGNANIVTVLSNEKQIETIAAGETARSLLEARLSDFLRIKAELLRQSYNMEDRMVREQLRQYIFGMECWYSGIIGWSSQSERY